MDASLELPKAMPDFGLTFSRVQSLQYRRELVHDTILTLASQMEIIKGTKLLVARVISQRPMVRDKQYLTQILCELDLYASRVTLKQRWAKDLLQRAHQVAELVS